MFPAKYRLTHDRDFTTLFKEGVFVPGSLFTLKLWAIDLTKYPRRQYKDTDLRIATVVGVKVDKRAVVRNKIRRQMREVMRPLLTDGHIKPGYLVAIVAKPEAKNAEFDAIKKSIEQLIKRAGLFV